MSNKLITLQQSVNSYSRIFLDVKKTPSKDTAKELVDVLEPLDKTLKELGHKVKHASISAANDIWSVGSWYLKSDVRSMLSVFIRRVDTQTGELEFERMRFRLADQLAELAKKLDSLEVQFVENDVCSE